MSNNKKTNDKNKTTFKELTGSSLLSVIGIFFGSIISLGTFYTLICQIAGEKGTAFNDNIALWVKIIILILVACLATFIKLYISIISNYRKLQIRLKDLPEGEDFELKLDELSKESIIKILDDAMNDGRYKEVISIGINLSLPLWYSGHYELRVKIGKLVEHAASEIGDIRHQAQMLIEDLGWTNLKLNNIEEGLGNIEKGMLLAESINDYYWLCQGCRNYADYYRKLASNPLEGRVKENEEKCESYLKKASEYLDKLEDGFDKYVLSGNVHYAYANYYVYNKKDETEALKHIQMSLDSYEKGFELDHEKDIFFHFQDKKTKLYGLKGDVYLNKGELNSALNAYEQGYRESKSNNVSVQIVKNGLQMCRIYIAKKEYIKCRQIFKEIEKTIKSVAVKELLEEFNSIKQTIEDFE